MSTCLPSTGLLSGSIHNRVAEVLHGEVLAQLRVVLSHELHELAVFMRRMTSISSSSSSRRVLPSVSTWPAQRNTRSQKDSAFKVPICPYEAMIRMNP